MPTTEPSGAAAFHDFEHAGWERAASFYTDAFGPLTVQAAPSLLDVVGATRGTVMLDLASGPGFVAAAAAERGARVTGVDFATSMVDQAKRRYPAIEFREGDAESLTFAGGSFDAVVMSFGMLHLARPEAAIAEAHRVLPPGGRYAFTVWAAPEKAVGFGLALRAIEKFGKTQVSLPEGPPFFRFSDAAGTRATLERAGFIDVDVRELPLIWRLTSAAAAFEAFSHGGVRTAAVLRAQTPEALAAIREAVQNEVEQYKLAGGYEIPMPAVLASGTRA
jgi:ubiquinone/menaquinone biosynthesis C-methylase UbiE